MKKVVLALGTVLLLTACGPGRFEPFGGIFDPVCLKDGSVAFYQEADGKGTLGEPIAKKEYCAWNQKK
ncbi:hypothetical protein CU669_15255 [Paramagnetospirillum kuznetsovii]|uniref:Lipoprotein n=1 Tax=Paramagnetospirillum kuznetsovii TaxID=2053833 RepID=A0A364NVJ2_9PROT|nr:lipoprotein [Paramagnetospirillum kuznetsovii]RAU21109.1 hypothetical protein CU669_15255 [Paramagnetospirillum kuznetsovii]